MRSISSRGSPWTTSKSASKPSHTAPVEPSSASAAAATDVAVRSASALLMPAGVGGEGCGGGGGGALVELSPVEDQNLWEGCTEGRLGLRLTKIKGGGREGAVTNPRWSN